jgi:choline dehydrogenase-like flavoprotein
MSKPSVIVVGSGAGGSVVAWALATAGHEVLVLEKGRNLLPGLGTPAGPSSLFGNDEVKKGRFFENQDPLLEPRTARSQAEAVHGVTHSFIGDVNNLPTTVGGGTIHWDAKVPRFWRQDFKARSMYGPVAGTNLVDWPLTYDELAPFYDEVEARLGVQGDVSQMPASTLAQAPRSTQFPLPPNPPMYAGQLLAEGAARTGFYAYPFPQAVHSRPFDGQPACNSCGMCSGFGCPINARGGGALSFLHHALLAGAQLKTRTFVFKVNVGAGRNSNRATGVSWYDPSGQVHTESADVVVLAPSAMETPRLCLLSATADHPNGLGNSSGQLGRNLMFHFFTIGVGLFAENVHSWVGPSTTFTIDDFVGPDRTVLGKAAAKAAGLPYLKGGICEVGGGQTLLQEAQLYNSVPNAWGLPFKKLMSQSPFRRHIAGLSMVGEDMPQAANRVDLDPQIRDVHRLPVPRITHSSHNFERVSSLFYAPKIQAVCELAPGALIGAGLPIALVAEQTGGFGSALAGPVSTAHIMGTARMGDDPASSVVDRFGRMHDVENVFVADGSVFVTSGGFNPSNTIMSLALRCARHISAAL